VTTPTITDIATAPPGWYVWLPENSAWQAVEDADVPVFLGSMRRTPYLWEGVKLAHITGPATPPPPPTAKGA